MSGNAFQKSFPSFLARLKSTSAQTDIQKELLEDAALTLVSEPQCFHVWQKVYPEYVVQSRYGVCLPYVFLSTIGNVETYLSLTIVNIMMKMRNLNCLYEEQFSHFNLLPLFSC